MKIDFQDKRVLIVAAVIILLIVGFVGSRLFLGSSDDERVQTTEETLPEVEVLPTVDSSVKVSIEPDSLKREVILAIDNIPPGTKSIDYELSYTAEGDIPKGVIGTFNLKAGQTAVEREITLGTCSSGACVYDEDVETINLSLKFTGPEGSSIFEKEFDI